MPIPLPNLDTRHWSDLVDEGRALIPRYSRRWTDHNVHDPGIMLMELFAWLTEQLVYRANRIPERHLRKFIALTGFAPEPPRASQTVLSLSLAPPPGGGSRLIPAGVRFDATNAEGVDVPFQLATPITVVESALTALQVFDGRALTDRSRALRDGLSIPLFGIDPRVPDPYDAARAPACYLGFDAALPGGTQVSLYMELADDLPGERAHLLSEAREAAESCVRPPVTCVTCDGVTVTTGPSATAPDPMALFARHHSVRTAWEYYGADNAWHRLNAAAGDVVDETRSFTLGGFVRIRIPAAAPMAIGGLPTPHYWVRCRLLAGAFDAAPVLARLHFNAAIAQQTQTALESFVIAPAVVPVGAIAPGARLKLDLTIDAQGVVQRIVVLPPTADAAELFIADYQAPAPPAAGAITLDVTRAGLGTGSPEQEVRLADAPIADAALSLHTLEGGAPAVWRAWRVRRDLDGSAPTDADLVLDATMGDVTFGDGVRGRMPSASTALLASYASTLAAAGNIDPLRPWSLPDSPWNRALLGADFAAISAATVRNRGAATGGAAAEPLTHTVSRAAEALWSHERLVELVPDAKGGTATIDQLERTTIVACAAPARLTTTLDAERLALDVPGTRVRRARAWAGFDPDVPCGEAVGTITVVIVPELPRGCPSPSAGLLRAVRRHLGRRRVLCTRLLIVGPEYLDVSVQAVVRALPASEPSSVRQRVIDALTTFLDPLVGGPSGRGWPFGRDVYRSEILHVIDSVRGVDHVDSLALSGDGIEAQCGNLCLPATWLVASAAHDITVMGP